MFLFPSREKERQLQNTCSGAGEKAQATLIAQSSGTPWQPITERHVKWLGRIKSFSSYNGFDESAHLQQLKNQLRYNLLIKEAEEAERMMAGMSDL